MRVCEGSQNRATGTRMRADCIGFEGMSGQMMRWGGSGHKESGVDSATRDFIDKRNKRLAKRDSAGKLSTAQ